jgi:hypothetical protein
MEHALYLFCLARGKRLPALQITGLAGNTPLVVEDFEDVSAVVCEVSLDDFSGPASESKLQDLNWLGPRAIRHYQVVEHTLQYAPVLPARFGTLFSSWDCLARLVERNTPVINAFFDSVTGKDEWSVKALVSRCEMKERLYAKELAANKEALDSLAPGVRYFKEKQICARVEKELAQWLREVLQTVAARLTGSSDDRRSREPSIPGLEGKPTETIANWAFLLNRETVENFVALIDASNAEYNSSGIYFELSGPWPPYSFVPALDMESET